MRVRPAGRRAGEDDGLTVVSRRNDRRLGGERQGEVRKRRASNVDMSSGWLARTSRIDYAQGRVVACANVSASHTARPRQKTSLTDVGKGIATRRESDVVYPSAVRRGKVSTDSTKWQSISPNVWLRPECVSWAQSRVRKRVSSLGVDTFDECREDVCLGVGRTRSEKDVVRMPVDREDGRPDGLLDVLGDPPVVLLVERADGDGSAQALSLS